MRAAPTDAETCLWRHLRAHRLDGQKFKRQQPIGNYIVDFVCFEAKLIVEVDGGQHNECVADTRRDEWLKSQGFAVLRFWNNEVLQNIEGVLTRILEALPPSPQPLSHQGRGAQSGLRRHFQEIDDSQVTSTSLNRSPSLSPGGRGRSREFASHGTRLRNGQSRQRLARPARAEGEGAQVRTILRFVELSRLGSRRY